MEQLPHQLELNSDENNFDDFCMIFDLDYDFVSRSLRNSAKPLTMTSKLTKILGPSERSFDALYEQQRETKLQLYSKQFDCHLLLPKSKMKAVMKRWMTANPNDI